jgi:hypothetical protein
MTVPASQPRRRQRGESPRRQAERAVAQLYYDEVMAIKAAIEAGGDARQIVRELRAARARQLPAPDRAAVDKLARLRGMVMERLARTEEGHEGPGPQVMPYDVDLGRVNMPRYIWTAALLGVVLAQNAVDGNPDAAGRPIPENLTFWDTRLPEFWHGDTDDDQDPPKPVGDWPPVVTSSQVSPRVDAA